MTQVDVSGVYGTQIISDGSFHHVAVTKNGSTVNFYIDGVADTPMSYTTSFSFGTSPGIGFRADNQTGSFVGKIDEVSVYNRALQASEIQAIYNAGAAGKCTAPSSAVNISIQPMNQSVSAGSNATFSVAAGGAVPLIYYWTFNGATIPSATNNAVTVTNVQDINAGNYQVVVSNAYGAVTSSIATLTLQGPPKILTQPASQSVSGGASVVFFINASGSGSLSYQWQFNGTNISGANEYFYSLTNVQRAAIGFYTAIAYNASGTVTSTPASLVVLLPPAITNQPQSQTNYVGGNVYFTVAASSPGIPNVFYQWRKNGTNIANATNATLALLNVPSIAAALYSVQVSNAYGFVVSSNALLTLFNPSCFQAPAGLLGWWEGEGYTADVLTGNTGKVSGAVTYAAGKVGQGFSFTAATQSIIYSNSAAYQLQDFTIEGWIKKADALALNDFGNICGYGAGGYGFGMNPNGVLFLSKIDVDNISSVSLPPILDAGLHHVAVTKSGTNVVFYIDGIGGTNQFYSSTFAFNTPFAIGSRADQITASFIGVVDEISLYNRALSSNEIAGIYQATSVGKCAIAPSLIAQSSNVVVVTSGNAASLNVAVSGTAPQFQWYQNGALILGATNSTLTINPATFFSAGNYSLVVSNSAGSQTFSNFVITVQPPPILANGSFETGNFSGWITQDLTLPLYPLAVRPSGFNPQFGFFLTSPSDGSYCATTSFEGNGPGKISLAQDLMTPTGVTALTFDYRAAWDMLDYGGSTQPRTFVVTLQPYGGGTPFASFPILTEQPNTDNAGVSNISYSVDLSQYSGRKLRLSFDLTVPEYYTGPGFFQLDKAVLAYSFLPPITISNSGSNIALAWPHSGTNYSLQSVTNLQSTNWITVATNLITRGLTNNTINVSKTNRQMYYRLRNP